MNPVRGFLERHLAQSFFNRVFLVFLLLQIGVFLAIAVPMIRTIFATLQERDLYLNHQIVTDIAKEFSTTFQTATEFNRQTYEDRDSLDELSFFLANGLEAYNGYRLDRYAKSKGFALTHFDAAFYSFLARNAGVQRIVLYSSLRDFAFRYEGKVGRLLDLAELQESLDFVRRFPESHFIPAHVVRTLSDQTADVYGVWFPVYDGTTGGELGILFVDVLASWLAGSDSQFVRYLRGDFTITAAGVPIYSSAPGAISIPRRGAGRIETVPCPGLADCVLTQVIDSARIRAEHRPILVLLYLLVGAFLVATTLLLSFLTRLVSRRVRPIIDGMAQLQAGNLRLRLPVPRRDELGIIAESFNTMAEELAGYIHKTYVLRLAQQEAEMKRLEAQINPHFLNNALEAIRMKALSDGSPDAAEMIYHLSRMFHAMARQKAHVATLQSEVKLCREYLRICELRYEGCFRVTFDVPPEHGRGTILTNLLQPIVENYIEHGLVRTRADNELAISSHVDNGVLMLRCRDNGRGISPERLAEIHAGLRDPAFAPDGAGIGLANVHRRIGIAYGESFGLTIGPGASGGTDVMLRLPWTTGE